MGHFHCFCLLCPCLCVTYQCLFTYSSSPFLYDYTIDKDGNVKKSYRQQTINTLKGSHKLAVGLFVGKGHMNSTRQQHQTTWQQLVLKKRHCKTTTTERCKSTTLQVAVTFKTVQYIFCRSF